MKILILQIIIALLICLPSLADELRIPFSCWPVELQEEFSAHGRKLDLNGSVRTSDSWGYIVNKGNMFILYTYRSATQEDFTLIEEIVFKIEGEKNAENNRN